MRRRNSPRERSSTTRSRSARRDPGHVIVSRSRIVTLRSSGDSVHRHAVRRADLVLAAVELADRAGVVVLRRLTRFFRRSHSSRAIDTISGQLRRSGKDGHLDREPGRWNFQHRIFRFSSLTGSSCQASIRKGQRRAVGARGNSITTTALGAPRTPRRK